MMTGEILVGVFDSPRDAHAARARLMEEGIAADRIEIDLAGGLCGTAAPVASADASSADERTRSDVVTRMFSGALMDDARVEHYRREHENGRCILTVRPESGAQHRATLTVLGRVGPRIYSLPDAPSAWNEASAGDPSSVGGADRDPGLPSGLIEDVEGLSSGADVARLRKGGTPSR